MQLLSFTGGKVPFGPEQRAQTVTEAYAMHHRYSAATIFVTVSPDDVNNPSALRLSFKQIDNENFPASIWNMKDTEKDQSFLDFLKKHPIPPENETWFDIPLTKVARNQLISSDPVASVTLFKKLTEITIELCFGINVSAKKTTPVWDISCSPDLYESKSKNPFTGVSSPYSPGLFGTVIAILLVLEAQSRLSLHYHALVWTQMTCKMLQRAANSKELLEKVIEALNSQITAHLPADKHLEGTLDKLSKTPRRVSVTAPLPASLVYDDEFIQYSQDNANTVNLHMHAPTCKSGKFGALGCRLCKKSVPSEQTDVIQIKINPSRVPCEERGTNFFKVDAVPIEPPYVDQLTDDNPLSPPDRRCLYYSMKKPLMKEFSDIIQGTDPVSGLNETDTSKIKDFLQSVDEDLPAYVIESINKLTKDQAYLVCDYLVNRNCYLVDYNDVLTALRGSNTAIYVLGSAEQSIATAFYLIKYISKDAAKLSESITVIADALEHIRL